MDVVNDSLRLRRKFVASTVKLTSDLDNQSVCSMPNFNDKVDLRPLSMINDNDRPSGKPHVDSVLQPSQRLNGIPRYAPTISAEALQNVVLRPNSSRINIKESTNDIKFNINNGTPSDATSNQSHNGVTDFANEKQQQLNVTNSHSIPQPPPPPRSSKLIKMNNFSKQNDINHLHSIQPTLSDDNSKEFVTNASQKFNEVSLDAIQQQILNLKLDLDERFKSGRYEINDSEITIPTREYYRDRNYNSTADNKSIPINLNGVDINRKFNEQELNVGNFEKWISSMVNDQFERISRIDTQTTDDIARVNSNQYKTETNDYNLAHNDKPRDGSVTSNDNSKRGRSPTPSVKSTKSNARSIKSVLFKRTEEEELYSDVEDDDVADINSGKTGFIDYASNKFTLHGPFIDKELNVYHAICFQFQLAARISFAKRGPFSRTHSATTRVYALIGSNRRSSWTNRDSWSRANDDLRVLDFIFRKVIRSNSKVIRKPVMELEHFTDGTILDERRFYKIIRSIFKKRNLLMDTLGIDLNQFDDIK